MSYSVTGAAYLILSFVMGLLAFRILRYWEKEKDTVAKIWFIAFFSVFLFAVSKTIVGLFFADNLVFLKMSIDVGSFFQAISCSTLAYFVFYVKFYPRISPWWGALPVFILGLISTIVSINTSFNPFMEPSGAINWGASHFSLSLILRTIMLSIVIIPTIIIFLEQFIKSNDPYVKRRAFGFIMVFFTATVLELLDFIFLNSLKLDIIWRDVGSVILSVVIIFALLSTWGRDIPKKV
jgi:hypothetical protein